MHSLKLRIGSALVCAGLIAAALPASAQTTPPPTPITAEQAFDAVQAQVDPLTGLSANVVLVDVRSRAEYYWVGAAARVNTITLLDGRVIVPDRGKVKLTREGGTLEYQVNGERVQTQVDTVKQVAAAPIAYNVPYQLWDEALYKMAANPNFATQVQNFAGKVVIFYCRSGGRTDAGNCVKAANPALFQAVYEIDQPDGATNHGGFEGGAYADAYNGYRGFPGRETTDLAHPSASWKDAGLPIVIGKMPPAIP